MTTNNAATNTQPNTASLLEGVGNVLSHPRYVKHRGDWTVNRHSGVRVGLEGEGEAVALVLERGLVPDELERWDTIPADKRAPEGQLVGSGDSRVVRWTAPLAALGINPPENPEALERLLAALVGLGAESLTLARAAAEKARGEEARKALASTLQTVRGLLLSIAKGRTHPQYVTGAAVCAGGENAPILALGRLALSQGFAPDSDWVKLLDRAKGGAQGDAPTLAALDALAALRPDPTPSPTQSEGAGDTQPDTQPAQRGRRGR